MDRNKAIALVVLFAIGVAGLAAGGVGSYLFYVSAVGAVILAPFAEMPDGRRRLARLAATVAWLGAWAGLGALVHDWTGSDYAVAGVVAVIALVAAARVPEEKTAAAEAPAEGRAEATQEA